MRHSLPKTLLLLISIVVLQPALADWTASGSFEYTDREYDENGFTGVEPTLPVRMADVEVVDANASRKRAVIATGTTDANGEFSIFVPDSSVRDVYVRVITRSDETPDLNIDVRENLSGKTVYHAAATSTQTGHNPNAAVNFGSSVIQIGQGGEAFNIYDQMLMGMDYLAALNGSRPSSSQYLSAVWASDNGLGAAFYCVSCQQLQLRDTAGYDDTVILHEMGHYAVHQFSASDSPAGTHGFMQCGQDIRLAFDEGFATYWGNSVLRHHQIAGSNQYVRTNGGPGPGNLVRFGDLETDTIYLCQGSTNELNNFQLLWDIADGPSTTDTTPGVDDPHDLVDLDDGEIWEVMVDHIPGAGNKSLEDFWDGWFLPPLQNGFRDGMIDIADHLVIEYSPDAHEVNDSPGNAVAVTVDGSSTHASLFSDPELDGAGAADQDYFSFPATAFENYRVETRNLLSDGNTYLEIIDTNGTSVLVANDNRASGDQSSQINWTAGRTDLFYARVTHAADLGVYGSYDLVITVQNPVDNDGDGYDTTTDCNDDDPAINPGATEVCDGVDQDCDGAIDNGFDLDGDGYTTCNGDCDDTDPNVNPGVAEVPANGIDDNCNGEIDEATTVDVVIITKATWKKGPKRLVVEATSDQQPDPTLTVVGFGQMTWNASKLAYTYTSPNGTPNPGTVTVESSAGGSDTEIVN